MDTSPLLRLDDHRKYQILLSMLQLPVTIYRPDICDLLSPLRRFDTCPREYHLDLAVRTFYFWNQVPTPQLCTHHKPIQFNIADNMFDKLLSYLLLDYPHTKEEVEPNVPP